MRNGVLFVSPSIEHAEVLSGMLTPLSIPLAHVQDLQRALSKLEHEAFGVVLTEADLPDGSWLDVMKTVGKERRSTAVIVTCSFADASFWADVMDLGAYDLLPQPFCRSEVQRIIKNALSAPPGFLKMAHTAL